MHRLEIGSEWSFALDASDRPNGGELGARVLEQVRVSLVIALRGRYGDMRTSVEVEEFLDHVQVRIRPNDPLVYYNQWVNLYENGRILVPEPDDGCTAINAKPVLDTRAGSEENLVAQAIELTDAAVVKAQCLSDDARRLSLACNPQPHVRARDLSAACTRWQGGRDGGSSLLRAAARVLLDRDHYFRADFITDYERQARRDAAVLAEASWLLWSLIDAPRLSPDEWNLRVGLPERGFAGRGVASKPLEDSQILEALKRGTIDMPLWGVSLDPEVADSYGGKNGARFIFQLDGAFPAIPAWMTSGIKSEEQELICGGNYKILSVEDDSGVARVRLGYLGPVTPGTGAGFEDVGSDQVLLETMTRVPNIVSSRLGRRGLPKDLGYMESLVLGLSGGQEVTVERRGVNLGSVQVDVEPKRFDDGWADPVFGEGETATRLIVDADAQAIADVIAVLVDPRTAALRQMIAEALLHCARADGEPWESADSFDVPGGSVQWTRVDDSSAEVHLEVSDGSDYELPLPPELIDRLVGLGWNAPQAEFRNCWARFDVASMFGDLVGRALPSANLVVLAATVGLGNKIDALARSIGV